MRERVAAWRYQRRRHRDSRKGRPDRPIPIKANLPRPPAGWQRTHFGKRVPRATVLAAAPPVQGITALEGPMGAGKTALGNRAAMTWAVRGSVVWTGGIKLKCSERHFADVPRRDPDTGERLYDKKGRALKINGLLLMAEALQDRMDPAKGWGHPDRPEWSPGSCGCPDRDASTEGCAGVRCPYEWMPTRDEAPDDESWRDRYRLRRWVVVFIDETAVVAGKRDWQTFPGELAEVITQIRKCQVVPIITCVHVDDVDVLLRSFVMVVWDCRFRDPSWFTPFGGGWIEAKAWPPESERLEDERPLDRVKFRFREADVRGFNSWNYVRRHPGSGSKPADTEDEADAAEAEPAGDQPDDEPAGDCACDPETGYTCSQCAEAEPTGLGLLLDAGDAGRGDGLGLPTAPADIEDEAA